MTHKFPSSVSIEEISIEATPIVFKSILSLYSKFVAVMFFHKRQPLFVGGFASVSRYLSFSLNFAFVDC